ncbi:hypothetical protein AAFF_G00040590 [Aldrovandia affinis]|uniref:Uncharacterized protein n=1 Tax=Aldrovandia affinis TaxID=143900 RepID=A0AAD7S2V5_9TELE|nr:hypothetical protein AAFF_G00040590 [Aldrovandia affinis]
MEITALYHSSFGSRDTWGDYPPHIKIAAGYSSEKEADAVHCGGKLPNSLPSGQNHTLSDTSSSQDEHVATNKNALSLWGGSTPEFGTTDKATVVPEVPDACSLLEDFPVHMAKVLAVAKLPLPTTPPPSVEQLIGSTRCPLSWHSQWWVANRPK